MDYEKAINKIKQMPTGENGKEKSDMKLFEGSIDLQLFNDGAGDAGGDMSDAVSTQPQTGEETNADVNPDAGDDNNTDNEESFEELIKGKHKDAFKKTVQGIINRRYAAEKAANEKKDNVMMKLYARYGVDNPDALNEVLDSEEELQTRSAITGKSPEDILEIEQLRASALKYELSERERAAQIQYFGWVEESKQVKNQYPEFDLDTELQNPQFRALISTKNPQYAISMEQAYRIIHFDELQEAAQRETAAKISQNVQARNARPDENALGARQSAEVKIEVGKLTKKERAEFAKRAARGEAITFQ